MTATTWPARRFLLLAVLAAVLDPPAALAAQGRIIVASPDGNPKTIERAVRSARAGDTVVLRGGSYRLADQLWLRAEGMTLRNAPNEKPVLELPITNPAHNAVVRPAGPRITVEGLEIIGGHRHGVRLEGEKCVLRRCKVHETGADAVWVRKPGHGSLIEDCEIFNTGKRDANAEGIDNVCTHDIVVRGNYIHHTRSVGVYMKGSARRCIIERNVVADTGSNGIMLGQSTDRQWMEVDHECLDSIARNNIVIRSNGAALAAEAAKNCRFYNNTIIDSPVKAQAAFTVMANHYRTPSSEIMFCNNLVVVTSDRPMFFIHANGIRDIKELKSDHNLYYHPKRSYKFWNEMASNKYMESLRAWQSATGLDAHSFSADPMLDAEKDHRLTPRSPAIDRGMDLAKDVPSDFKGTERPQVKAMDIGAWEFAFEKPAVVTRPEKKQPPVRKGPTASERKAAQLYRDARAAERAGMKALARTLYERLVKDHPDSEFAEKARSRIR